MSRPGSASSTPSGAAEGGAVSLLTGRYLAELLLIIIVGRVIVTVARRNAE